jgi:hypothetical protein
MVDDELKVVTFLRVIIGKGIIVVALVRFFSNLGICVALGIIALVVVVEGLIVRLKKEEERFGDLTIVCNGDAEPFTTLLEEGKEEQEEIENFAPREGIITHGWVTTTYTIARKKTDSALYEDFVSTSHDGDVK